MKKTYWVMCATFIEVILQFSGNQGRKYIIARFFKLKSINPMAESCFSSIITLKSCTLLLCSHKKILYSIGVSWWEFSLVIFRYVYSIRTIYIEYSILNTHPFKIPCICQLEEKLLSPSLIRHCINEATN